MCACVHVCVQRATCVRACVHVVRDTECACVCVRVRVCVCLCTYVRNASCKNMFAAAVGAGMARRGWSSGTTAAETSCMCALRLRTSMCGQAARTLDRNNSHVNDGLVFFLSREQFMTISLTARHVWHLGQLHNAVDGGHRPNHLIPTAVHAIMFFGLPAPRFKF